MKNDIAIFGAGGLGREIACIISRINHVDEKWNLIGFFDDNKEKGYETGYGKIMGNMDDLNKYDKPLSVVVAIGNPQSVKDIVTRITNPLISFPNIIGVSSLLLDPKTLRMGKGNIITYNCSVSCNVTFGDFNIVDGYITIGHDCVFGDYNALMHGTRISGEVQVGDSNFFGTNSIVLQCVKVANNDIIGANTLIKYDTDDNSTYVGSQHQYFQTHKNHGHGHDFYHIERGCVKS